MLRVRGFPWEESYSHPLIRFHVHSQIKVSSPPTIVYYINVTYVTLAADGKYLERIAELRLQSALGLPV